MPQRSSPPKRTTAELAEAAEAEAALCVCRGCTHHKGHCTHPQRPDTKERMCDDCAGASYWAAQAAGDEGVTGGFQHTSPDDLRGSRDFITPLLNRRGSCLDSGAGNGRVTGGLLADLGFARIDCVEPRGDYLREAVQRVPAGTAATGYSVPLQRFVPDKAYDLVWVQWVLMYLSDVDVVQVLRHARDAIGKTGLVVLKENVGPADFDEEDRAYTRPAAAWRELCAKAGLRVVKAKYQKPWPANLDKVYMLALRPANRGREGVPA